MRKAIIIASAIALASCQTSNDPVTGSPQRNNTAGGAVLGAVAGAVGGLLIAKNKGGKDQAKSSLDRCWNRRIGWRRHRQLYGSSGK